MREQEYEKRLNIQTEGYQLGYPRDIQYHRYEPTPYLALEQLFNEYPFENIGTLVDYGCGKGRVPIYVHNKLQINTIGIEMDPKFYVEAEHNKEMYLKVSPKNRATVKFHKMMAEEYEITKEDTIFFFFNPFSIHIFRIVVGNILKSYEENTRDIYIMLYYPTSDYLYYLSYETPFQEVLNMRIKGKRNINERIVLYKIF